MHVEASAPLEHAALQHGGGSTVTVAQRDLAKHKKRRGKVLNKREGNALNSETVFRRGG